MAEEIQIQGSSEVGKIRNPLGVIGLSLITFGVYFFFWYYYVNKEMAEIGKAKGTDECGTNPGNSLLALIPGAFIIVPPYVSEYNATKRLQATERVSGAPEGMDPVLLFLLMIFIGPVGIYFFQTNLNQALQAQAAGGAALGQGAAQAAPPAPEQPVQQPQQPQQ
jgi:uncharacterized protein DUF4234